MTLHTEFEVENTRRKLQLLEERYKLAAERPCQNEYHRELTLQSLKRMINQMKEEIAVFETHNASARVQPIVQPGVSNVSEDHASA